MQAEKKLVFISHATPEDNYLAAWLASKLRVLGYEVWADVNDLNKGQAFWPKIQTTIREESVKFLAIVTRKYVDKSVAERSGVLNEITAAFNVVNIPNFIIPLKFDETPFADFPIQFGPINGIDFSKNWADGLNSLLKQFDDDHVPKSDTPESPLNFWLSSKDYKDTRNDVPERYYTNWFPIDLPDVIFGHQLQLFNEAQVKKLGDTYPFVQHGNTLFSFLDKNELAGVSLENSVAISLVDFLSKPPYTHEHLGTVAVPNNLLVDLLNKSMDLYVQKLDMVAYPMANHNAFYFPFNEYNKGFIKLEHVGKGNKKIMGKFRKENLWHLGISYHAALKPFPHYKINTHIFFSDMYGKIHPQDVQVGLRRGFAVGTYNKDWTEYLLALMLKIGRLKNTFNLIPLSSNIVTVHAIPFSLLSDVGYFEPNSKPEEDEE